MIRLSGVDFVQIAYARQNLSKLSSALTCSQFLHPCLCYFTPAGFCLSEGKNIIMKKIVCFHLYNDFSGSPKVLRQVVRGMLEEGHEVVLVTSRNGILDNSQFIIHNSQLTFRQYNYKFAGSGVVTALRYVWVQVYTFFVALGYLFEKDVVFYINTILPVGPAVAGWLMRKRVIYHYHENAMVKGRMYRALAWVMQRVATEIICVSEYQRSFLKRQEGVKVVPNALDEEFLARAVVDVEGAFERKTVLMLGSLKGYKGTKEFVELARRLEQYRFVLVLNDEQENIDRYFEENGLVVTENLKVYARQEDVVPFYREASVVLNLTDKTQAIETFGLTALEARAFGLPVIVPTVGGIAEMVEDGVNGWKIDVQELDVIAMRIEEMLSDREVYERLCRGCLRSNIGRT